MTTEEFEQKYKTDKISWNGRPLIPVEAGADPDLLFLIEATFLGRRGPVFALEDGYLFIKDDDLPRSNRKYCEYDIIKFEDALIENLKYCLCFDYIKAQNDIFNAQETAMKYKVALDLIELKENCTK